MPTTIFTTGGWTVSDILERLYEVMAKPVMLSIRQLCELRDRARLLGRWKDVENYTEQLWTLGYYD